MDPQPRTLLLVTGPSHAGKSSLLARIADRLGPDASVISMDEHALAVAAGDAHFPTGDEFAAAYDWCTRNAEASLDSHRVVLVESTLTQVDRSGSVSTDESFLTSLRGVAERQGARLVVVCVSAPAHVLAARRDRSGRLTAAIVDAIAETWSERPPSPECDLTIDTGDEDGSGVDPVETVVRLLERPTG